MKKLGGGKKIRKKKKKLGGGRETTRGEGREDGGSKCSWSRGNGGGVGGNEAYRSHDQDDVKSYRR